MTHRRLIAVAGVVGALAAALCSASFPGPAAAAAPVTAGRGLPAVRYPGARVLDDTASAFPLHTRVLAASPAFVLFASVGAQPGDVGQALSYYRVALAPGRGPYPVEGGGILLDDDRTALGGSSAGSTYVAPDDSAWLDLASGAVGPAGDLWQAAIPGGGAWVTSSAGRAVLLSTTTAAPAAAPVQLATLPDIAGPSGAGLTADAHGIAVWNGISVDYYAFATRTVTHLDTAGAGTGFSCTAATAGAVACTSSTGVLRIPTDGSAPVVVSTRAAEAVALTPSATAWIDAGTHRLSIATATRTSQSAGTVNAVVAAGGTFAWSTGQAPPGNPGAFDGVVVGLDATAGLGLAAAPQLRAQASAVAVTAGRVAWIDDSAASLPVRAARVVPDPSHGRTAYGPPVTVQPSSLADPVQQSDVVNFLSGLDVSDSRTVAVGRSRVVDGETVGTVEVSDLHGTRAIATGANGDVAISETHVLYGKSTFFADPETLYAYDLRTGRTENLTARYGIYGPAFQGGYGITLNLRGRISGRYVVYAGRGGIRRLDLQTGISTLAVSAAQAGAGIRRTWTAGDFVAWTDGSRTSYRNARTMSAITRLPRNQLLSVSPAGFTASSPHGAVFRRWGNPRTYPLPDVGSAVVSGPTVAWIDPAGRAATAPFPAGAARPRALGAPLATASVRAGRPWRLDEAASAALTSCHVVIRRAGTGARSGPVVARLGCIALYASEGEAVAGWDTRIGRRPAPAGRYRWQVVARNRAGAIVADSGSPGVPVTGEFRVVR